MLDSEHGSVRIAVVYTCVAGRESTLSYATRFVSTYHTFESGVEHDLFYMCNGGALDNACKAALSGLGGQFIERDNTGWDIGGYIFGAYGACKDYDMMFCLGESVYFHRPRWLVRLADSWQQGGVGIYGPLASYVVRPHLLTTAFATSPDLLRRYPHHVETKEQRYEFEHGKRSFWGWVNFLGKAAKLVTWDGCWGSMQWRVPDNILWRGTQSNCLVWCNHTDTYATGSKSVKAKWARMADTFP